MNDTLTKEDIEILTNVVPELNLVPENAPSPKQLDEWNRCVEKNFFKLEAKTQKVDPRVFFYVDNLWPNSSTEGGKYTVTYRFHVVTHMGYKRDGDGQFLDGKQNRKLVMRLAKHDFFIDVDRFLKEYKEAI